MPVLSAGRISKISRELLVAAGTPTKHAVIVADHLADANLVGHDSHGFIRIIQYLRDIDEDIVDPKGEPLITGGSGGLAQIDGSGTFGQVAATFAVRVAIEKARHHGISFVTTFNHSHTGRVGAYPETVAKEGMASTVWIGVQRGKLRRVAPFGGREGRMGTNPIAMGFPYKEDSPILLDFATSMAAEGKMRVYQARGKMLPGEWLLDANGKPSRDPNDLYNGGAILPMGGIDGGHKGYALAFMVDLMGGTLAELTDGTVRDDSTTRGASIMVIDLSALGDLGKVKEDVHDLVTYLKDTPPMAGHDGVLYPGEIEATTRRQRLKNGIDIEQATWDKIAGLIREHRLDEEFGV